MVVRRVLCHSVVVLYLAVTLCALHFTLFRRLPPIGRNIVLLSYAMTAPFQGYATEVYELSAEGMYSDGSLQELPLERYYPYPYGERVVRGYLNLTQLFHGTEERLAAYQRLSQLLADRERLRGNDYELVRLYWKIWPVSPDGLFALQQAQTLRREPVSLNNE